MEDRRAPKNSLSQGIPANERPGVVPRDQGVLLGEWKGRPAVDPARQAELEATQGVPMPGPGMASPRIRDIPPKVVALKCDGITKKGKRCRAYATTGSAKCVGHAEVA